jgi:PAS domain S-box-containing protein
MDESPIRVLHVDDDPSLLELTGEFLGREDDHLVLETATSADEGLDQIGDRPPDCIVSDYDMPGKNGIEFLQAVRETHPDLPFILFTGKGSESVASDAMAAGVTDYLQKGSGTEQYELLANRITNAVQAQRATQEATRQEELMRLTEFAGDTGGFELDLETEKLILTDGTRRLINLSQDDSLGLEEAIDLYHPDDRDEVRAALDQAAETGEQVQDTWRVRPTDGEQRLLDVTVTPVRSNGDITTLRGAVNDTTERYERRQELESERRFIEQSLNALDDLFYVLDTDGTIRQWNDRVIDVTGYTESELDGMDATEIFPEYEQEGIANAISQTLAKDRGSVEADLQTADGDRIPYEWTGARLTDTDDTTTGIVGIGRDLSERRQRERRFRALVEESNDVISIIDADGRFQYQSPSLERILGYDPEETVGEMAWEYIHPDDREAVMDTFEEWLVSPEARELIEYRARHADGSWRWFEARASKQFDNPAVEGYVVNSRDVTAQKEREQQLEEYETILETLSDAVYVLNEDGQFTYVNDEFVDLVGYDRETIIGNTPSLIKDEMGVETAERQLGRLLSEEGPETVTFEVTIQPRDGDPIICEDHMSVLPYEGDTFDGSVGALRDITDRKERTRELERQNDRLEEFTGVVSHDLRNPLRTAGGRLELAQADCDSAHLDDVAGALNRMDELIKDLLTLARGGETVGNTEAVSLSSLIEKCWEVVPGENATLMLETDQTIWADQSRLQQLLENLFANAVEHGGEDVTVRVGELEEGFYVADDGVGIPDEERKDIFGAGYSTAEEGTGFGLRIAKQVVEAHGWDIRVTDSDDDGAQFEITGIDTPA